ncbi:2OG-Fe(II) oxygenase [Solemya velum gill symbiont]|uniref:2OG-Fe(II) oxygenase n=1 Tax=Solemya velum gill symbiont TaxID=2340 RepID=UPI0009977353|nr:2OG-Fe(II) oxygenase [Solemya velum gill symbiont]OOZ45404.1 2OG-Fe(II) oxygenase [Solemya velum gill symbiont]OOZ47046.1 2OG-Fe(II) oxygenase [Solemya velum gill symbiont]OOZ52146.1 2OG-Fe(II) oxygenase [Solemya velum gill symbiont]OOZ54989.1 2OG-Fe(II) oxygenase [Solemya velum gill symbiont]OOZ56662.1 2OG-Fe(II) oxygenase [Solemya velum gill symbiont]
MVAMEMGHGCDHDGREHLFEAIARDVRAQGYSINHSALPPELGEALWLHVQGMREGQFNRAGIGRQNGFMLNTFVRSDEICWITGDSEAGSAWLAWTADLQRFLNRRLFLGLFSFESHFAHYASGDYYKRHLDAFRGESNRILTIVVYLNPGWAPDNGGELLLYREDSDLDGLRVTPNMGTVVVFLSEEFPHEVLAANRDRYSISGWFRLNTTTSLQTDPPG